MRKRLLPILLLAALAFAMGGARAEKADRNKPMNIEADALRHDELKQTSVFTGRVVVTKGTILLRGARLDVRQDPDGFQYGTMTAEAGKRAFFRQKRDTAPGMPDEFVEGEGEVIEYDGRADLVRLIRRSELRRYRESTLTDEMAGALIVYNNLTDVFTVDGQKAAPAGSNTAATPGGRVRAVLSPKETPAKAGAPAAAPTSPAPALRPSGELGGGAK
ncbi:lipopolysaccharide transport periplasmic protein LptA [Acidovorax sp. SUPP950]|uniref:lipopolysaccharide transport periplasmic protein LptA n=1 Tax=unclassified Acidovorax TaxID=2684926 RepID=UPI00234B576F|nr:MULTISPECIES: lipopolysaccharide transport periplasmic protein LptA [unclassified Acidovorax]WCM97374.1 lipopolysaccharide transport periplasmic protein LptA [Acidovorax sp. GBBC 1281]GKS76966.1 lipopolysaccharide transport periplasmic protein LptA [Acidovorax sp. SUPP950]GKS85318.1 lipopolysaccharide transport periplasmic protein LptA [Acidovorax sp. SUPP1855]GKS91673.1 lipopolysaccharide transport periplasmic protein LptA [Acidovorax sp. SUPP2539]GKS93520.1 lipopolysaccharide transport pe